MKTNNLFSRCLAVSLAAMLLLAGGCKKDKDEITDGDGNVYTTVSIDTQVWLKENLKTTRYNDGTAIPYEATDDWVDLTSPAYCWFGNVEGNKELYGGLYNFNVVKTGKVCPTGFHVPSRGEVTTLTDFLGANAGGQMKSMTLWNAPNEGATNISGFTALPGGMRASSFIQNNMRAYFWTSTPEGTGSGYFFYLSYDNALVEQDTHWGSNGLSIRCVQD